MENYITYEYIAEHHYGIITINRPEKHNAISLEMTKRILQSIEQAKKDPIKFLVVTGTGTKMFCSGGDLNDLHGNLSVAEAESSLLNMMEVLYELTVFKMPTIALLNGGATGGGCELASACDLRIARGKSKFGFVQTNLGIIPGWGGGVLLAKCVHPSFANQWIMEGAIFETEYLIQKGWIHRQVAEDEWLDRDKLLQPYLTKSFSQMRILKGHYLEEIGVIGLKQKMKREVQNCASLWESEEHKNAVLAFFKRS
ncbi:enoyl-CoA hydratase/isomerase family protein [Ornithinibacillus scapharcae]|uniref:enoyl-CoA hydratase/isomerase family protein n=1 Tax=Ornithinibacillus scapharcae TaxID=1147159 RepID=UPI000225AB04|nr:enoyl-CoA hydratase/isomerase family protein [Ornithinibacillus scapharcae]